MKKLLIVGYGDISRRVADRLPRGIEARALARRAARHERVIPFVADLDHPDTLAHLGGWADAVLHCAPPPPAGETDTRTGRLLAALERATILPTRVVYIGTSGVYGDCGGALVDETRPLRPQSARALRRADAERQLTEWSSRRGVALVVLRAPGIYAADRLPLERLRAATPVLEASEDVYTNHVHADDLAGIVLSALAADAPAGIYNANDDTRMKVGDWFDLVADRQGLPRPPRVSRAQAARRIPAASLEFLRESRLLDNRRMKVLLGAHLAYPTVFDGVPRRVSSGVEAT